MIRIRKAMKHLKGGFCIGVLATLMCGAVLSEFRGPHPREVIPRWGISEKPPGVLHIEIPAPQSTLLDIRTGGDVSRVMSLTLLRSDCGAVFKYEKQGPYDFPVATYGGGGSDPGSWVDWRDLNADGRFDERVDHGRAEWMIRGRNRWLPAVREDGRVETPDGRYEFRPRLGYWAPAESRPTGEDDRG